MAREPPAAGFRMILVTGKIPRGFDYGSLLQSVWRWVAVQRSLLLQLRRNGCRGGAHAFKAAL